MRKKNVRMCVRVTPELKEQIRESAKEKSMTIEDYFVWKIDQKIELPELSIKRLVEIKKEFHRVNDRLNQIAHALNGRYYKLPRDADKIENTVVDMTSILLKITGAFRNAHENFVQNCTKYSGLGKRMGSDYKTLDLNLYEHQQKTIYQKVKASGMSIAEYVSQVFAGKIILTRDYVSEVQKLETELRHADNNARQMISAVDGEFYHFPSQVKKIELLLDTIREAERTVALVFYI